MYGINFYHGKSQFRTLYFFSQRIDTLTSYEITSICVNGSQFDLLSKDILCSINENKLYRLIYIQE